MMERTYIEKYECDCEACEMRRARALVPRTNLFLEQMKHPVKLYPFKSNHAQKEQSKEKEPMKEKPFGSEEKKALDYYFACCKGITRTQNALKKASEDLDRAKNLHLEACRGLDELFFPGENLKIIRMGRDRVAVVNRIGSGRYDVQVKPVLESPKE